MAILIRYAGNEHEKAIYLSQRFYRLIHRKAAKENSGYTTLRDIALLKYKSPTLTVKGERLQRLISDLKKLQAGTLFGRKEIAGFLAVCENASSRDQGLWVSGDMHPEL